MFHPNLRECIECRLFDSGRLADNQTCQRLCKDEIITVETLGECVNTHTCTEQMADRLRRGFNICCICSYFLFFFTSQTSHTVTFHQSSERCCCQTALTRPMTSAGLQQVTFHLKQIRHTFRLWRKPP